VKFTLLVCRRGLLLWSRSRVWPYRIAWKRESLRDLFRNRKRPKHKMRERRKRMEVARGA
jgi:hypothetical protein